MDMCGCLRQQLHQQPKELGFVCLFSTDLRGSELDMAQTLKEEILLNPRTSEPASGDTRTAESWGKEASKWTYVPFFFSLKKWMGLNLCL